MPHPAPGIQGTDSIRRLSLAAPFVFLSQNSFAMGVRLLQPHTGFVKTPGFGFRVAISAVCLSGFVLRVSGSPDLLSGLLERVYLHRVVPARECLNLRGTKVHDHKNLVPLSDLSQGGGVEPWHKSERGCVHSPPPPPRINPQTLNYRKD